MFISKAKLRDTISVDRNYIKNIVKIVIGAKPFTDEDILSINSISSDVMILSLYL